MKKVKKTFSKNLDDRVKIVRMGIGVINLFKGFSKWTGFRLLKN